MSNEEMGSNSVEAEYLNIANNNEWVKVYKRIGDDCATFPCVEARKPQNKSLNRYRDVNPYDHSRIILQRNDMDYINANLVKMERANRKYILTQGPLTCTVGHFWLMVWEQNSHAILMLNKVIEKNEIKCHWYWPYGVGDSNKLDLPDVKLSVTLISEDDYSYYAVRVLRITDMENDMTRDVIQFHYTTWPDFGVPSSPVVFLDFLTKVRLSGALDSDHGPPVVHCSAGIGRSGTFCLVDSCLVIIEKEGIDNLKIQEVLLEMRKDRMGLIQTPDQLRFSYQAIIDGAKRLKPDWKEDQQEEENLYSAVAEELEEAPPPLPPRGESLSRPPVRPLPAIPASVSHDALSFAAEQGCSTSDDCTPPLQIRESASSASSTADEDDKIPQENDESGEPGESLHRRRTRELSQRVVEMKRRVRNTEQWQSFKRSLYKPLTITFGFILAGVIVYTYVKH